MNELTITCPNPSCQTKIPINEALARPFLEAERGKIEAEVARRLEAERRAVADKAAAEATSALTAQLKASETALAEKESKLREAQSAELAARKAQQDAEQAKQDVELTVRRRVDAERQAIAAKATADATAALEVKMKASEAALAEKDDKLRQAQAAEITARKAQADAEQAKRDVEVLVQRQVEAAKTEVATAATKKAREELLPKLREAEDALAEKDAKLKVAQEAEMEARRLRQEAEEAKREVELTVARRLDEERSRVRDAAVKQRDDEHRLQMAEKDKQLADMREQIEEARRKGNAGSQQLAGDVQEIDLHDTLQKAYPGDRFERVKKGQRGGDVVQTVISPSGAECGRILWESKRTKAWSDAWLSKARDDQREAKADLVAIASETLPDELVPFGERDKVWVSSLGAVVPVAGLLRLGLLETAAARRAGAVADSARDQVFAYLTSSQFRQRITRVADAYKEMRDALDAEKRSTARQWAAREKQLDRVVGGLAGFYGDLQGLAGASMPVIEQLAAPKADEPEALKVLVVKAEPVEEI